MPPLFWYKGKKGLERAAEQREVKTVRWTVFSPWESPWIADGRRYACRLRSILLAEGLEQLNVAQMSAAGDGWAEPNLD